MKVRKTDSGQLPLDVPECFHHFFDPSHRIRVVASHLYKIANALKSINFYGMQKKDCERIKVYFGYFIKLYNNLPFDEFRQKSKAILEHHFNDHRFCDRWCKWSPLHENVPKQTENDIRKYRNKLVNDKLYAQMKEILSTYLSDQKLFQVHHPYTSQ